MWLDIPSECSHRIAMRNPRVTIFEMPDGSSPVLSLLPEHNFLVYRIHRPYIRYLIAQGITNLPSPTFCTAISRYSPGKASYISKCRQARFILFIATDRSCRLALDAFGGLYPPQWIAGLQDLMCLTALFWYSACLGDCWFQEILYSLGLCLEVCLCISARHYKSSKPDFLYFFLFIRLSRNKTDTEKASAVRHVIYSKPGIYPWILRASHQVSAARHERSCLDLDKKSSAFL